MKQCGELYWNIMPGVRGLSGVWERYSEFFSNFCLLRAVCCKYDISILVNFLTEKYFLM